MEAVVITLLERRHANVVRLIELFFSSAPPLSPELQLAGELGSTEY